MAEKGEKGGRGGRGYDMGHWGSAHLQQCGDLGLNPKGDVHAVEVTGRARCMHGWVGNSGAVRSGTTPGSRPSSPPPPHPPAGPRPPLAGRPACITATMLSDSLPCGRIILSKLRKQAGWEQGKGADKVSSGRLPAALARWQAFLRLLHVYHSSCVF